MTTNSLAVSELKTTSQSQPKNISPDLTLKQILELASNSGKTGQIEAALSYYYQAAKKINQINRETWQQLAECYSSVGNWQEAEQCYRELIKLNPQQAKIYLKLTSLLEKQGKKAKAIATYQQLLSVNPQPAFEVYKRYGRILMQTGKWAKAIEVYQKALELKPKPPAFVYVNLGNAWFKQQHWQAASDCYQQAVEINPTVGANIYLKAAYAQNQLGQNQAIVATAYQKWLDHHYLVNHQHKIIYCPIPTTASSPLDEMMIAASDRQGEYQQSKVLHRFRAESASTSSNLQIHNYIQANRPNFKLGNFALLNQPEYSKIIVLIDPFARLVNTYIDQFWHQGKQIKPQIRPIIKNVYEHLDIEAKLSKSITFSQFIHYLARTENHQLLPIWLPQYLYYADGLVQFDLVGQWENLEPLRQKLKEKWQIELPTTATQEYKPKSHSEYENYKFHECYPDELASMNVLPRASQLYTPELEIMVRERYAPDIDIYEREFGVALGRQA